MPQLEMYTRFYTADDSVLLTGLLDQNKIPYEIEHEVNQLDHIYLGESSDPMFVLKLPKNKFAEVTALLATQARVDFERYGFEHYLTTYDIPELEEIGRNPNDWNSYDLQIAELLLQQHQKTMPGYKSSLKFITSYQPEKIATKWLVVGYTLCLLTIMGVFFGLSITQAKKTLQSGETVNIYDKPTVAHGNRMIVLGSIMTAFFILSKIF